MTMQVSNNISEKVKVKFRKRNLYIIFALLSLFAILWTRIPSALDTFHHTSKLPSIIAPGDSVTLDYYFGSWSWIFYFTNIANIAFFVVTFVRIFHRKGIWSDNAQLITGSYMIIVGIIYWGAIAPGDFSSRSGDSLLAPGYLFVFIVDNLLIHTMTVIFAIVLIIIGIDRSKIKIFPTVWLAIIFPLFYYSMAWTIYITTDKLGMNGNPAYIYSFLDFYHPYGVKSLIAAIGLGLGFLIGILGIFFIIYFLTAMKWRKKTNIKLQSSNNMQIDVNQEENIIINPQTTKPKTTNSQTTKPQTTKPQTTKPQTTKPQTTKPQTTKKTLAIKKTKKKSSISLKNNSRYFIQKSTKSSGWELKKTGATRATFVAKTKLEVQTYYSQKLYKPKGTVLLEKGKFGKIRHVTKKRTKN